MNKPTEPEQFEGNKQHFNEYTMQKKRYAIPRQVYINLKPRKSWSEGITLPNLRKTIVETLKHFPRNGKWIQNIIKRGISKATIYAAISDLNLYRDDIYIISNSGINLSNGRKEHRYYCPYENADRFHAKKLLQNNIFRNSLKKQSLEVFEDEVEHQVVIDGLKVQAMQQLDKLVVKEEEHE